MGNNTGNVDIYTHESEYKTLLTKWNLSQYISRFDEHGYDCVDDWFTALPLQTLLNKVKMKEGHAHKFVSNVKQRMALHSDSNVIAIKVHINEDFLETHSFDLQMDISHIIEIGKENYGSFLLCLKQQIPFVFALSDLNKYSMEIVSYAVHTIQITSEDMLIDHLAINADKNIKKKNIYINIKNSPLELRVIFHEIASSAPLSSVHIFSCFLP